MIKAILFDLDDTLLDLNLSAFMAAYGMEQCRVLSRVTGRSLPQCTAALAKAYLAIDDQGRLDGMTNERLMWKTLDEALGTVSQNPSLRGALAYLDAQGAQRFRNGLVQARPRKGNHEAIEAARCLGLTVALATNPCFTLEVDRLRLGWAELTEDDFADITHLTNSTRNKPSARYYLEFISRLGLQPEECLMVGNDIRRDFCKPDIGMVTAYVGHGRPKRSIFRGDLASLADHLPQVVAALDARPSPTDDIDLKGHKHGR